MALNKSRAVSTVELVGGDATKRKVTSPVTTPLQIQHFGQVSGLTLENCDDKQLRTWIKNFARQVMEFERNISTATRPARSDPSIAGKVILKGIVFASNANTVVKHGMGRAYVGWRANRIRKNAAFALTTAPLLYEVANPTVQSGTPSLDNVQLTLFSGHDFIADIEVW